MAPDMEGGLLFFFLERNRENKNEILQTSLHWWWRERKLGKLSSFVFWGVVWTALHSLKTGSITIIECLLYSFDPHIAPVMLSI